MNLKKIKVYKTSKTAKITLHLLFWAILMFISFYRDYRIYLYAKSYSLGYAIWGTSTHLTIAFTLFYVNDRYIASRYFKTRQFKKFAFYIVLLWALGVFLMTLDSYLWLKELNFTLGKRHRPWTIEELKRHLWGGTFVVFFYLWSSTQIRIMIDWFRNVEIQKDLENQRLTAELSMLKLQVSPHFLFNTLNNIYSLAFQQRPQAPEAILKLSDIMRYMLYEANAEKVSLQKEITYVENFIDLQKLRLRHTEVRFNISGNYRGKQITPMLLLPLVENSFKYGVSAKEPSVISIDLSVEDNCLIFTTENKVFQQKAPKRPEEGGIGLSNTRKRLEFMYPKKHQFKAEAEGDMFLTRLEIEL